MMMYSFAVAKLALVLLILVVSLSSNSRVSCFRTSQTTTTRYKYPTIKKHQDGVVGIGITSPINKHHAFVAPWTMGASTSASWLTMRMMTDDGGESDGGDGEPLLADVGETTAEQNEEGILDKINAFLDTPILDPNEKTDQGPIQEALKGFVRDDPETAQLAFSVFTVFILGAFALFLRRIV
mmetsp:Transcript_42206/g.62498  ORF Transcript_42206/g.62498 Transcript_42206/m.62498 type:complete len:182 (+) Transcript_42206:45-590(+)